MPTLRVPDAPTAAMPHRVKPMLSTFVDRPFDRAGWLFEVKWDGYRAIAEVEKGKVRLYSRNFLSFEKTYASIVESLAQLDHDAVLDGEVVVADESGKAKFQLLQRYQKSGKGTLLYYVFDLLYLDGKNLCDLPLRQRKELLAALIAGQATIRLSEHIEEKGVAFYQAAVRHDLEGIMAKKADSPYRQGLRSTSWLKIKTRREQEAVIGGFTKPRGSRAAFGALVLGVFEGDDLVYIGRAGSGFTDQGLQEVHAKLVPLVQKACPFKNKPKTNTPAQWVKPTLVCEVSFQEWSDDGHMRIPVFLGLREDVPAHAVRRELPKPPAEVLSSKDDQATADKTSPSQTTANSSGKSSRSVPSLPVGQFTNLDKVFWPEEGFTKGDLLAYYAQVAPVLVPHLRDRPLSLHRHPNGIHGQSFFQKDTSKQPPPAFVQTAAVASETRGGPIHYILCQNEATLLYVVQLGCIELNPWNSRVATLDKPDYLIVDLDPQDVPFAEVVEAAQEVRKLLEKSGAECFCKTSGKRGLHVYVPLGARYDYDLARQFAEIISRLVHGRLPRTTSMVRDPKQRRHKVYLDFLQNRRGQTMAAPYSVRPVPGALVSTPLKWREVTKNLDPAKYSIQTVPRRLDKVGDLWQPLLGEGIDLEKCLGTLGI